MPDLPHSVHPSPFPYGDPAFQIAAHAAKSRSRGHCQECGRQLPLEAHHWALIYPPADQTTADDLIGLCRDCHDGAGEHRVYLAAGGSPERFRAAQSELTAILMRPVGDGRRVGWVVRFQGRWAAIATSQSRPRVGEVFWLFLLPSRRAGSSSTTWGAPCKLLGESGRPHFGRYPPVVLVQCAAEHRCVHDKHERADRDPVSTRQADGGGEHAEDAPVDEVRDRLRLVAALPQRLRHRRERGRRALGERLPSFPWPQPPGTRGTSGCSDSYTKVGAPAYRRSLLR